MSSTIPSALIPNLPPITQEMIEKIKTPMGDRYHMHSAWHTFFSEMTVVLQNTFSQEGFTMPNQSTANIASIVTGGNKNNALIVDNQLNELQVILNGVLKTVTVT
jgi:hypothetical protein